MRHRTIHGPTVTLRPIEARMGAGPLAVVDSKLLVHGVEGLRIADASVIPLLPSGNTIGPTTVVAERAADFIPGRDAAS